MNSTTLHDYLRIRFKKVTEHLRFFSILLVLATLFLVFNSFRPSTNESDHLLSLNELKKKKVYYSLQNALQNPDQVYKLSLYHNAMLALPSLIKKFDNLQVLDISRNRLKELPEEIGQLKNLQYLNVEDNQLTEIPASINNLKNLEVLNLRRNDIEELPPAIGGLKDLRVLTVEYNAISSLPDELAQLQNLKTLNLKNNQLNSFNKAICSLEQLQDLDIQYNEITALPNNIQNLKNLDQLGLNLSKLTIKEINKYGKWLLTTNTELGRQYLQSHDALNTGKFAELEIHVSSTQKVKNSKELYRSTFEYNHLVKQNSAGKGIVIWKQKHGKPVVVRSEMTEDQDEKLSLKSASTVVD